MDTATEQQFTAMLEGNEAALGRLISLAEHGRAGVAAHARKLVAEKSVPAYRVGVTGAAGVGKSTLVSELTSAYRRKSESVGVVSIDPSSVGTRGAVLGDRVRMQGHLGDRGVFIRSMATRNCAGGLADAATAALDLLDASGKQLLILESTGVGQSEIAIAGAVDVVVLVLVPESGDCIQFMKSGVMEIADVIVVNKADRLGADAMVGDLKSLLGSRSKSAAPTVLQTDALRSKGIEELRIELDRRRPDRSDRH